MEGGKTCSHCQKGLKKYDIFCQNCKSRFCSSDCKKKAKKTHGGGRCETVHSQRYDPSGKTPKFSLSAYTLPDGTKRSLMLEPDVEEVIFGHLVKGDQVPGRVDPVSGELFPECPVWRVFELLEDILESNWDFFKQYLPNGSTITDEDWEAPVLVFTFRDYEDLARQYLDFSSKRQLANTEFGRKVESLMEAEVHRDRPLFQVFNETNEELERLFSSPAHVSEHAHRMGLGVVIISIESRMTDHMKIPYEDRPVNLCRSAVLCEDGSLSLGLVDLMGGFFDLAGVGDQRPAVKDLSQGIACVEMSNLGSQNLELYRRWLKYVLGIPENIRRPPLNIQTENLKAHLDSVTKFLSEHESQ